MDFTAVMAHGYTAAVFMSNETVSHGSDFTIDAICRTLQRVRGSRESDDQRTR